MIKIKYVVCYSGGHSSALVAVEAVRRYGKENVILLNHDISPEVEHEDVKRFKNEVAEYLGLPITYANMEGWEHLTPLRVSLKIGGFKFGTGTALCTYKLKSEPFYKWLDENYPVEKGEINDDIILLYGFDKNEEHRIQRRVGVLALKGYRTDYPLALWDRTIENIEEIGINRPVTYELFKHANCIGCLKAGRQHWYLVYCLYPELFKEAIDAENEIGYSIIKDIYMEELEPKFKAMKCKGIVPTEKIKYQTFWAMVRKEITEEDLNLPCECAL